MSRPLKASRTSRAWDLSDRPPRGQKEKKWKNDTQPVGLGPGESGQRSKGLLAAMCLSLRGGLACALLSVLFLLSRSSASTMHPAAFRPSSANFVIMHLRLRPRRAAKGKGSVD